MKDMIIPNHLAVILDGNRRWALKHNLKPWQGHSYGAEKFEKFLEWCLDLNIPRVSAYVLSTENLNRPKEEVEELMRLFYKEIEKLEKKKFSLLEKYEVKVNFLGDLKSLPPGLVNVMDRLMKKTRKYNKKVLNLLVAYGGKFELTRAFKKLMKKAIKSGRVVITKKNIEDNLFVSDEVDLVIRTGGEYRLSNFLPWQTTYAELIILKKLWPDITKKDLIRCIKKYNRRQRRFGH